MLGSSGLIGRHAAGAIEDAGRVVVRASRSGTDADLSCDLTRPGDVSQAIERTSPESVLMAAGCSSVAEAWNNPAAAFSVNTGGIFNLLEAIRLRVRRPHLVVASSGAVYGSRKPDESVPARPVSPYGASKLAAEVLCRQYTREHGLEIAIARIFNQIGPGQMPDQAPAEFAREIATAESRGESDVRLEVGNPESERDYLDVRDTARALGALLDSGATGILNVCSGRTTELSSIIGGLSEASRLRVEVARNPDRAHPVDPSIGAGSNRRLVAATGWAPEVPLGASLRSLLEDWRRRV